ncbi:hypothetical protein ACFFLM_10285 [Deinococcus oregonensis]|uniref:Uncharacterized protein n=1 Tax=Deinococcus oregonensis TaxID=1805970 RepID=A0ABV6B0D1_9DEIO
MSEPTGRVVLMAALLLCGMVSAQTSKPHRPRASAPFSTPSQPAYRPDDQPEFPPTSGVSGADETRIAPGIWDTPPDLIGETQVGVFADGLLDRRFLFIAANESRIGEDYLVLRCVSRGQYELRLVLQQPLLAQNQGQQVAGAYRVDGAWTGSTRTLKLGVADPAVTDALRLSKAEATALFDVLLQDQLVKLTVSPLPSSGALLRQPLTRTFDGVGIAAGWNRIDRCQP